MSVAKVVEIKSSSTKSFDDAIKDGLARAGETIQNIQSAWINEQEVIVSPMGEVKEYRVLMKVTFIVQD